MDGCNNDIPEYVAKIHKSVSMKQRHWDHDGFKQEETKPCRMSEGHAKCAVRLHGSGESRSRLNTRSDHSAQSPNLPREEKNLADDCTREHRCSRSAATEQTRNKGRRPDIQVYVPRAKRMQQTPNLDCSQKEMPEDNKSHDKSGNQDIEKLSRRPKHKSRPSLEPYVPRPRRSPQQTENTTTGRLGANNVGQNTVKGQEEVQNVVPDVLQRDALSQSVESGSSVGQSSPERLKRSPNYLEMGDEDLKSQTEKQHGHHKSKRKHHSKDKECREERKSLSKERKVKHHSRHRKHQIKDNVNVEDKLSYTAVSDDCEDPGHSVTSSRSKMVETSPKTSSVACDPEGNSPSDTHVAGLTMGCVSSVSGKSGINQKTSQETEPLDSMSQSMVEVQSEDESKANIGERLRGNISNEEKADKMGNRLDSKLLPVDVSVIEGCKDSGAKSEDCDPDKSSGDLGIDNSGTADATSTELIDEKMEVDGELLEQGDQFCSVDEQISTCEVKSSCDLKHGTAPHVREEEMMSDVQGCETNAASGNLMSGTSRDVNSENSHLNPSCLVADRQLAEAGQSEGSLQISRLIAEDSHQAAGTQLEENSQSQRSLKEHKPHNSSQSEARKESSQPEKVVEDGSLKRSQKSSQSEEKPNLKRTELNQSTEEDSWDTLYDESGEALDSKLMEELTAAVGNVEVQKPEFDYYNYQPKDPDLDYEAYGHLIEIYNFPSTLITRDLFIAFKEFEDSGFDIKWVDDNHAIGVFSSAFAAKSALTLQHPLIKVRPLCEATRQTKVKAKKACEFLQPYRPRPETVASVARNLVAGALGIRSKVPKEKREEERRKLHDARERKRQSTREKRDAWNGVIGHCAMDEM